MMAPLIQWAVQLLLGFTPTKDIFSSTQTQPQIIHQTNVISDTTEVFGMSIVDRGMSGVESFVKFAHDSDYHYLKMDGDILIKESYLGGSFSTAPIAISRGSNQSEVFGIGSDGQLWHKALLTEETWDPPGMQWECLGGVHLSQRFPIAVVARNVNSLDVFGISVGDTSSLVHKSWNGSSWQPSQLEFGTLGGNFSSGPAVGSRRKNEMSLFIVDGDNRLRHRWWHNEKWNSWATIGTNFRSVPAVVTLSDDRLSLFAFGLDGNLYFRSYAKSAWLEWENLGGNLWDVSAHTEGGTIIHVVGLDLDGTYRYKIWNGTWSPNWELKLNHDPPGLVIGQPGMASRAKGELDIYGIVAIKPPSKYYWQTSVLAQKRNGSTWIPTFDVWRLLYSAYY